MSGTVRARQWWTPESMRADLAVRDPGALVAIEALVLAVESAGVRFDPRQTMDPKLVIVVEDPVTGKVGDLATVSYQPNGAVMLELDFTAASAPRNRRALPRVEALLDRVAAVDEELASMVGEIRGRGLAATHPNRPLAQQSPESVATLVALAAEFNAGRGSD
ncbi:hypothetical protein [Sinomonas sp. G460-2]|uniref:hypothetical protein n=1 Tax=Sinomonas sp. G460-2 TaxID=3393464 RepID=UPI0039EF076F